MVERLAPSLGGSDGNIEVIFDLGLTVKVIEALRPQTRIQRRIFGTWLTRYNTSDFCPLPALSEKPSFPPLYHIWPLFMTRGYCGCVRIVDLATGEKKTTCRHTEGAACFTLMDSGLRQNDSPVGYSLLKCFPPCYFLIGVAV
jgi:hypothetical protein